MVGGVQDGTDLALACIARRSERAPDNFAKLLHPGDSSQHVTVEPEGTIIFPDNPLNVFHMTAEVQAPGKLPFVKARRLTAFKPIPAVGGLTQCTARRNPYVIREEDGRRTSVPADLNEAVRNPESEKDVPLATVDILVEQQGPF